MIRKFRTVIPGTLFRGSAPTPEDVVKLHDKLGIRKIVSLDQETGQKIDHVCKLLNIKHVKIYIGFDGKSLLNFLSQDFRKLFLQGGPTFVHCLHGKDRTGLAVALVQCLYLHVSSQTAIDEAKSLGLGIGMDPKITKLYEEIIRHSTPKSKDNSSADDNDATIVSNERAPIGDNRDSVIDQAHQGSFAPYLDHTRQNPIDSVYNYSVDQYPTRQNYPYNSKEGPFLPYDNMGSNTGSVPLVGEYDNDGVMQGVGPVESYNGFFSEISH